MDERKNIERFFQEKFKNFEADPPEHIWGNIDKSLNKKGNKRKVIPLWWKIAGAAALLAGVLWTGNLVFSPNAVDNIQGVTGTKPVDSISIDTVPQESVVTSDDQEDQNNTTPLPPKTNKESNTESNTPSTVVTDGINAVANSEVEAGNSQDSPLSDKKMHNEVETTKVEAIAQVEQKDQNPINKEINDPSKDAVVTKDKTTLDKMIKDEEQDFAQTNEADADS